jgi:hypothetical protein
MWVKFEAIFNFNHPKVKTQYKWFDTIEDFNLIEDLQDWIKNDSDYKLLTSGKITAGKSFSYDLNYELNASIPEEIRKKMILQEKTKIREANKMLRHIYSTYL